MNNRWIGALAACVLYAATTAAQPVSGEDALVLTADQTLGAAMRNGDKSIARKLLALQFTFVDETGAIHVRKDFLGGLKAVASAPSSDAQIRNFGRLATVTGHRKSARNNDVFFLEIWAKQKGAWRAMIIQHVVLGSDDVAPPSAPPHATDAKPYVCLNPCQAIPYRPRSPAEQDVINAYQAIEKARVAHDANEWAKHVTDDFVVYGSGQPPNPKAHRVTAIRQQNETPAGATVGEVQTMRIWVYGDAAAMTATYVMPDQSRPNFRAARVWLKRNGQWLMAISQQTDIK